MPNLQAPRRPVPRRPVPRRLPPRRLPPRRRAGRAMRQSGHLPLPLARALAIARRGVATPYTPYTCLLSNPLVVHPTHLLLHPMPGERHLPRVSPQRCTSTFSSARSTTRPRTCALGTASAASVRPTNRCESGKRAPLALCQAEAPCLGEHGPSRPPRPGIGACKGVRCLSSAAFAVPTATLCSVSAYGTWLNPRSGVGWTC